MPLIKYFAFVGSALTLSLIGLGWCLPQPLPEPASGVTDRPPIRIASAEQLPERVIIDTSLPTIAPPPSALEFTERWPQETVADLSLVPKPATPPPVSDVSTKQKITKRERSKKVAVHRAEPKANSELATSHAATRSSLLDILKEGVGQTQAKLMAGLEPLTAYVSKSRPETR